MVQIFQDVRPRFGQPAWLGLLLLVIPLLLGYGYAFPRAVKQANLPVILLSGLIALVNGLMEEMLWRSRVGQSSGRRSHMCCLTFQGWEPGFISVREGEVNKNTMQKVEIIRAGPEDAGQLKTIAVAAKAYWGYPEDWMARWADAVRITPEYIRENEVHKAMKDGEIAGWYALVYQDELAILDHMWVRPDLIRRGIGRRLFNHAVQGATANGARQIETESDPNAVGFYQHMGLRLAGKRKTDLGRRIPIMVMDLRKNN